MFKSSGWVFCVVVMAAFVFGCGGGGGGTAQMPDPPPDTPPPPAEPTDAERIAEAQQEVMGILSDANEQASAASLGANALRTNADATPDQIANAASHSQDAQDALALIVSANSDAQAATTPAAARAALADAQMAQIDLNAAASAITFIQNAVQAVTDARTRREADQLALTNNSSLIQHLRDNKLLSDAVLGAAGVNLTTGATADAGSIRVGAANNQGDIASGIRPPCAEPCAEYPLYTGAGAGADRVSGQRTVRLQGLISNRTTPALTGTSILPYGFDLNNAPTPGTTFVNAYTDINPERRGARNAITDDEADTPYDERHDYILDTDYLLAGIWLTVGSTLSDSRIVAFAYGSQPIAATDNFCVGTENGGTTGTTTRTCGATSGLNSISGFVDDNGDFTATYTGDANGAYLAGSDSSYFTGDVTLTAEFRNPPGGTANGTGSIVGEVTNIVAGGQSMAGSIELQKHTFNAASADNADTIGAYFGDDTVGVVDGKSFSGAWKGQFFGYRVTKSTASATEAGETTITTTYSAEAPGSVAGTFYATQQSNPAGSAAFIGAFGADRP